MSRLADFFNKHENEQIKLFENGAKASDKEIEPRKIKRRAIFKKYLTFGASLAVLNMGFPKQAKSEESNDKTDNLNKTEVVFTPVTSSHASNALDIGDALTKEQDIERIANIIRGQTKEELTFSIKGNSVLYLGEKAVVGEQGVDYKVLPMEKAVEFLNKYMGAPGTNGNSATRTGTMLLSLLDTHRKEAKGDYQNNLSSSDATWVKTIFEKLQRDFDRQRSQNLINLESKISANYDAYKKAYDVVDNSSTNAENISNTTTTNENADNITTSVQEVVSINEYYAYDKNLKEAQSLTQNTKLVGDFAAYAGVMSLSFSPEGRELINKVSEPFLLSDGSKCTPTIKTVGREKDLDKVSPDKISYVDYSNPNKPVIALSSALFVSQGKSDNPYYSLRQSYELLKGLVSGLKEIELYKQTKGEMLKDPLQKFELIKSFNDEDKKAELLAVFWETQQIGKNNPKATSSAWSDLSFNELVTIVTNADQTMSAMANGFESAMSDKLSINETNAVEAAKPVKECVKDGVKKAADLYYKYDTYTGGIKEIYSTLNEEERSILEKVIAKEETDDGKNYLLALAIPTLKNEISAPWLKEALDAGYKFYAKDNMGEKGGETDIESTKITMNTPVTNEKKNKMYAHLLDFSHELRHSWQGNNGLMVDGSNIQEKFIMNECLEADASAMSILTMHSYKTNNAWAEAYNYSKDDESIISYTLSEHLIDDFEKAKDGDKLNEPKAVSLAFKTWFDLLDDYGFLLGIPDWKDVDLRDTYKRTWADNIDMSKYIGKETTSVSDLSDWLKKFTMPKTGEKYVSDNVGAEFLNQDKVKGVDQVTYDKLVKKIRDYFEIDPKETILPDNVQQEIANLPKVYGSSDSKKENNNSTKKESSYNKSNNVKTSNSLQIKQADARQKIEFYKSKQKSKDIRNNFVNVTISKKGRV